MRDEFAEKVKGLIEITQKMGANLETAMRALWWVSDARRHFYTGGQAQTKYLPPALMPWAGPLASIFGSVAEAIDSIAPGSAGAAPAVDGQDNGPGVLEVGVNDQFEIVVNLPRGLTGHINFSAGQARGLAKVLEARAAESVRARSIAGLAWFRKAMVGKAWRITGADADYDEIQAAFRGVGSVEGLPQPRVLHRICTELGLDYRECMIAFGHLRLRPVTPE